ncbi:MAG TPA: formate dehydrogenase accessory sulfurtransferase FdhD [Puia sp.]|nr:formate dehydrogenase accessory sulfurtransferase FdhD [Puia sp.]
MTGPSITSPGITSLPVQKISADHRYDTHDLIVVEEPLEIVLEYGPAGNRSEQSVSVTMRTPGHDLELALGFLFTEGILPWNAVLPAPELVGHEPPVPADPGHEGPASQPQNTIRVALDPGAIPDLKKLQRHFYTSSSCGVCGKISIESLYSVRPAHRHQPPLTIKADVLYHLPYLLREGQNLFDSTGGLHAAGLFDRQGHLLVVREDIGRHNALDKLIGHALHHNGLPLDQHILLLSGRACFELIQKAAMAGFSIIAAVGPPSSLAVQLAQESGITLVGFLKAQRFNIYTGAQRIQL